MLISESKSSEDFGPFVLYLQRSDLLALVPVTGEFFCPKTSLGLSSRHSSVGAELEYVALCEAITSL